MPQDHAEYVRARVLSEIADDYEEVLQIVIQINGEHDPFVFMTEEIKRALRELPELGWAKAYDLWVWQTPLDGVPDMNRFDQLYFWITPEGKASLDTYPLIWFPTWNED